MKKPTGFKRLILPLSFLVFLGSCKKDEGLVSRELLVYMQGDFGDPNNQVTAPLTVTPVAIWGGRTYKFPLQATREVVSDVTLYVEADPKMVDQFNADNKLKARMMPDNSYK